MINASLALAMLTIAGLHCLHAKHDRRLATRTITWTSETSEDLRPIDANRTDSYVSFKVLKFLNHLTKRSRSLAKMLQTNLKGSEAKETRNLDENTLETEKKEDRTFGYPINIGHLGKRLQKAIFPLYYQISVLGVAVGFLILISLKIAFMHLVSITFGVANILARVQAPPKNGSGEEAKVRQSPRIPHLYSPYVDEDVELYDPGPVYRPGSYYDPYWERKNGVYAKRGHRRNEQYFTTSTGNPLYTLSSRVLNGIQRLNGYVNGEQAIQRSDEDPMEYDPSQGYSRSLN